MVVHPLTKHLPVIGDALHNKYILEVRAEVSMPVKLSKELILNNYYVQGVTPVQRAFLSLSVTLWLWVTRTLRRDSEYFWSSSDVLS